MDRVQTVAAVLHYAEGTLGPVDFHPDGCGICAHAVELVDRVDHTYPAEEDPMPVFVIKGKDRLAPDAVNAYYALCLAQGLSGQAAEVADAAREIRDWQARRPDLVKTPDHPHVPARPDRVS